MVGMPPAPLGPIARSRWSGRVPYAAPGVLGPAPALRPRGGRYGTQGDGLSMATAAEVAAWMLAEFERTGELAQADAAAGIRARFGEAFVADGRIRNDVLAAFRRLAPEGRVWSRHAQGWRRRNAYDPPRGGRGAGAARRCRTRRTGPQVRDDGRDERRGLRAARGQLGRPGGECPSRGARGDAACAVRGHPRRHRGGPRARGLRLRRHLPDHAGAAGPELPPPGGARPLPRRPAGAPGPGSTWRCVSPYRGGGCRRRDGNLRAGEWQRFCVVAGAGASRTARLARSRRPGRASSQWRARRMDGPMGDEVFALRDG